MAGPVPGPLLPEEPDIPRGPPLSAEERESIQEIIAYLERKTEQWSRPSIDDEQIQSYLDLVTKDLKRELVIKLEPSHDEEKQSSLSDEKQSSLSDDEIEHSSSEEETESSSSDEETESSSSDEETKSLSWDEKTVHPSAGEESSLSPGRLFAVVRPLPELSDPSTSSGQMAPDECRTKDEDMPADLNVPPSSLGQLAAASRDNEDQKSDLEGIDDEDERQISFKKHAIEMARLRRECDRKVERANREKKEALTRALEKEAALERVEKEKCAYVEQMRQADEDLEQLRRRLKKREMRVLRKRRHSSTGQSTAAEMVGGWNFAGLDCLVLVVTSETVLYVYMRKFDKIIPTLYKHLDKIFRFLGWFIAKDAKINYDRVKNLVKTQAQICGQDMHFDEERMEVAAKAGGTFNLPGAVCSTLRVDMQVIEADVRVLSRLFNKPTYDDDIHPTEDPEWSVFLAGAQKWIEEKHARFMSKQAARGVQRPRLGSQTALHIEEIP